mmetsp:Transcript_98567/g.284388  ORF Transcript_98567/g.284388 Transcript_98567/m.284388 type:complete len:199 (-) Transcript_98567:78-674(-)
MGNAAAGEIQADEAAKSRGNRRLCGSSQRVSSPTSNEAGGGGVHSEAAAVKVSCLGRSGGAAAPGGGSLTLPIATRRKKRGAALEPSTPEVSEAKDEPAPEVVPAKAVASTDSAESHRTSVVRFAESPAVMPITPYSQLSWASTPQAVNDDSSESSNDDLGEADGGDPAPRHSGESPSDGTGGRTTRARDSAQGFSFG